MKRPQAILLAAFLGAATAWSEEKAAIPAPVDPSGDVVAVMGTTPFTSAQVDQWTQGKTLRPRTEEYNIKRQALEDHISQLLLNQEAAARGISVQDLLRSEVEGKEKPVTEKEKKAFFEQNKARFGAMAEADAMNLIENHLRQEHLQNRQSEYLFELRSRAGVRILLEPPRAVIPDGDYPAKGPADAPVTIVEFSDFECLWCGRVNESLKKVQEFYGDHVRVVFRHFPLSDHKQAPKAAEAADCAREQGKFWQMHDRLFENQSQLQLEDLKRHAAGLGLNARQFDACLDSGKYASRWKQDLAEGSECGVSGTPSFFINGRFLSGGRPFEHFAQVINDELTRAGIPIPDPSASSSKKKGKKASKSKKSG